MSQQPSYHSAAVGSVGRVLAARIHPDQDVLEAIERVCLEHGILRGQITTSIGSFKRVHLHYIARMRRDPDLGYNEFLTLHGPHSLLTGQGLVSPGNTPDRLNIHYHAVISGKDDVIYGGHIEAGTVTLTTLDLFVVEVNGIEIERGIDPGTGALVTSFRPNAGEAK